MQTIQLKDETGEAFLYIFSDKTDKFIFPKYLGQVIKINDFIIRPSKEQSKRIALKDKYTFTLYLNDENKDKRVKELEKWSQDYYSNMTLRNKYTIKLENLESNQYVDLIGKIVKIDGPNFIFFDGTLHLKQGKYATIYINRSDFDIKEIEERVKSGDVYVKLRNLSIRNYMIYTQSFSLIFYLPPFSKDVKEIKKYEDDEEFFPSPQQSTVFQSSPSLISPIKPVKYLTKINYEMDQLFTLSEIINYSEKTWKFKCIGNIVDYFPKENFYHQVCEKCLQPLDERCNSCESTKSKKNLCLKFKIKDQTGEIMSYLYHKEAVSFKSF